MKKTYWELEKLDERCSRVKVAGGWVVIIEENDGKKVTAISTVFLPDQHHRWEVVQRSPEQLPQASDIPDALKPVT